MNRNPCSTFPSGTPCRGTPTWPSGRRHHPGAGGVRWSPPSYRRKSLSIYGTILKGAFGVARKSWTTWENVAILLGISLAVTPAFKMRFWNIGAEGQVLISLLWPPPPA